jgi:hypothetical protein
MDGLCGVCVMECAIRLASAEWIGRISLRWKLPLT